MELSYPIRVPEHLHKFTKFDAVGMREYFSSLYRYLISHPIENHLVLIWLDECYASMGIHNCCVFQVFVHGLAPSLNIRSCHLKFDACAPEPFPLDYFVNYDLRFICLRVDKQFKIVRRRCLIDL